MPRKRAETSVGRPMQFVVAEAGAWAESHGLTPLGQLTWQSDTGPVVVKANVGQRDDGVVVIADLHVSAPGSRQGLTSRMLQAIPLSSILNDWEPPPRRQSHAMATATTVQVVNAVAQIRRGVEDPPPRRPAGRPARSQDYLRNVALAYLAHPQRGVYKSLAEKFGRSRSAMIDAVSAARRDGWLAPARQQGARSGDKGPLLLEYENAQNHNTRDCEVVR